VKKQKVKIGALFAIELSDRKIAFGRDVNREESIFYDYLGSDTSSESIAKAYKADIVFRVAVMKYAVKSGRWKIVDSGHIVDPDLALPRKYFMQDILDGKFSIYEGGVIVPSTREACFGLERCAVWDPEHVEARLRDHFAGKSNLWIKQLKPA
jgi:Immunity protein 26